MERGRESRANENRIHLCLYFYLSIYLYKLPRKPPRSLSPANLEIKEERRGEERLAPIEKGKKKKNKKKTDYI